MMALLRGRQSVICPKRIDVLNFIAEMNYNRKMNIQSCLPAVEMISSFSVGLFRVVLFLFCGCWYARLRSSCRRTCCLLASQPNI
jgi:hypothetical protein